MARAKDNGEWNDIVLLLQSAAATISNDDEHIQLNFLFVCSTWNSYDI